MSKASKALDAMQSVQDINEGLLDDLEVGDKLRMIVRNEKGKDGKTYNVITMAFPGGRGGQGKGREFYAVKDPRAVIEFEILEITPGDPVVYAEILKGERELVASYAKRPYKRKDGGVRVLTPPPYADYNQTEPWAPFTDITHIDDDKYFIYVSKTTVKKI